MNPIMSMLNKSSAKPSMPNNIQQMIADVKSGKVDAKQKVHEILKNLNSQQKQALNQMLPKLTQLGKVMGASDKNISSFTAELKQYLN